MFKKKNDCDITRKAWNWGMKCGRDEEDEKDGK